MSFSVAKTIVLASSSSSSSSSSPPNHNSLPPPHPNNPTPPVRRITPAPNPPRRATRPPIPQQQQRLQPKQKQPSVVEIERAIGAGLFRDRDPREREENKTLFDVILSNSIGTTEGSLEKTLRETGEWVLDKADGASRSSGKQVLIGMYLWTIPIGLLLLVASGVIKLPFSTPFLDDLIL